MPHGAEDGPQLLFSSYAFIFIFLPLTVIGFAILRRWRIDLVTLWLVGASAVFYAYWSLAYLLLLLVLMALNYRIGAILMVSRSRSVLALGLAMNLSVIGFFKYSDFFISNIDAVAGLNIGLLHLVLPLGISFFTFQKIAFLVDCYKGRIPEIRFRYYCLFVLFFPQLIAGPIVHYRALSTQFRRLPALMRPENYAVGLTLFTIGLVKKTVIADSLAGPSILINQFVTLGGHPTLLTAWLGPLLYTFQLYFDFSGYSDMAVGLARLFGIRLPANFWSPYKAHSIAEFWRRWHMTLSRFLRDYLYVPLGGKRKGPARRYLNLTITMLLGGLWHGAAWTFVLWGGLHGVYLAVNQLWRVSGASRRLAWVPRPLRRLSAQALTFLAVVVAWAFFQASSVAVGFEFVCGMFGWNGVILPPRLMAALGPLGPMLAGWGVTVGAVEGFAPQAIGLVLGAAALAFLMPNSYQIMRSAHPVWRPVWTGVRPLLPLSSLRVQVVGAALAGAAAALGVLFISKEAPFLYWNF
jgi:alginate O-acetyltransferase complex protein AlgI